MVIMSNMTLSVIFEGQSIIIKVYYYKSYLIAIPTGNRGIPSSYVF